MSGMRHDIQMVLTSLHILEGGQCGIGIAATKAPDLRLHLRGVGPAHGRKVSRCFLGAKLRVRSAKTCKLDGLHTSQLQVNRLGELPQPTVPRLSIEQGTGSTLR